MPVGTVREIWRYPVKSMGGERLDYSDIGGHGLQGDRGWAVRSDSGQIHNAKRFPRLMQCAAAYREPPTGDRIPNVDITFPDGETIGSDSPALAARLSDLMGRRVALHPVRPATDTTYYRRREPGAAIIGALARYRPARRVLAWMATHGLAGGDLRAEFGRDRGEALPDLTSVPAELFEFYTPPGTYFDAFPVHVLTTGALAMMARLNPGADWDVRRFRPNIVVDTGPHAAEQIERRWIGQRVRIGRFTVKGEMPTMRCAMPMHAQSGLPRDASVLRTVVREADQCLGLYASVVESGCVGLGEPVDVAD
ncbi:MAG TPA: MOSC N-terminal beta barrel domain-containing protein [Vicinamibacterales bacterium]